MRNVFVRQLMGIAAKDPSVILMTGDLGFKVFDEYRAQFPQQFLNMGVAESNMVGVAAGLALEGKCPFIYSIMPFLTMRSFEQIRNDVCFHGANVKLVGVGGGFSYGPNGSSHHAMTDVALMRTLPEMMILTPGDPHEARWAVEIAWRHQGPVYIRLGRAGESAVHAQDLTIASGEGIVMSQGNEVAILVSGLMLHIATEAAALLTKDGHSVRLISFPSVKPLDNNLVIAAFNECHHVFTLEEHSLVGGFASAVSDLAIGRGLNTTKFRPIAAMDRTVHAVGSQEYLRQEVGLDLGGVLRTMRHFIKERSSC